MQTLMIFWLSWDLEMVVSERQQLASQAPSLTLVILLSRKD